MEMKKLQNQKGFTLVEIAIVLVIIGLLLGGVLKGQEMINAAKVKNDTDSLVGMQASAYAYRDRMGYYPGSDRSQPANVNDITTNKTQIATAGDDVTSSNAGLVAQASGDFFEELANQEFLKDPNVAPSLDENGSYTAGFGTNGATTTVTTEANMNYICIDYTGGIPNAEEVLRGMDIKLDDGDPDEGKFRYDEGVGPDAAASGCFEI